MHYLLFGGMEGRDPSSLFDSKWYLQQNPDVRAAGVNPLLHFLRRGESEGRQPRRATLQISASDNRRIETWKFTKRSTSDKRVKAACAMAPGDIQGFGMDASGLGQMAIPVYLIVGAGDTATPPAENAAFAAKHIPQARLDVLPQGPLLLRGDSVAFPPEGCAYLHRHQGPGIRCLLEGGIRIDTHGRSTSYGPGGAWYETGPDGVFAQAADRPTRFIRVMILPRTLLGKSSLQLVNEEDKAKPRAQQYKVFVDAPIAFASSALLT